jgi:hypothetical protein
VFEPVIFVGQPGVDEFKEVIDQADHRLASGDIAATMAGLTRDALNLAGSREGRCQHRIGCWDG